ncbi:hypothetical protein HY734_02055 [Candidatus Uhrbacteria bacterium]|nr:hypothetical protein [Candidatus Uhrbacteria bacterium]
MTQTSKQAPVMTALFAIIAVVVVLLAIAAFIEMRDKESSASVAEPVIEAVVEEEESEPAPVYFATMTHLEGGWTQALEARPFFDRQASLLRMAYDLAEDYDAVITIESEIPMAEAMIKWDDNLLQEALDRGQGVGTHCDIDPKTEFTTEEMIQEFALRKAAVDALVDPSENLGCAGGGGPSDWYVGAIGAGFKYLDGIVGFHYLALPISERPDGWIDRTITQEYYHYAVPVEEEKRFYPFVISEVGFVEDPDGELVVSAGDIGAIQSIAELDGEEGWEGDCDGPCEFTREDVDVLVDRIRSVVESRDTSRLMKLQVYIATQYYDDPDMEYFFQEMQTLQEEGVMEWASQKQVYEALTAS